MISDNSVIIFTQKNLKASKNEYSKRQQKKELKAILQKMIEADTVLLEWSDELWLTVI